MLEDRLNAAEAAGGENRREAAVRDSAVVINLVGILFERGRQRFAAVHAGGAEVVARAAVCCATLPMLSFPKMSHRLASL